MLTWWPLIYPRHVRDHKGLIIVICPDMSYWQLFVQSLPFVSSVPTKSYCWYGHWTCYSPNFNPNFFNWRRIIVHILVKLLQVIVNGPGRLVRWNLYVTYNVSNPQVPIRMQIWQKVQNQESTFKLLYETRYVLTSRDNGNVTVADN